MNDLSLYTEGPLHKKRDDLKFKPFLARVLTVDYERYVMSLEEVGTKIIYKDVSTFPVPYSSATGGEINMPEQFSGCVACNLESQGGFNKIVILSWLHSDAIRQIDAIAQRPVEGTELQGYSDRLRGTYRKAYPGQKTSSYSGGYSERVDKGWDRLGADFSRDFLDSDRRTWSQITGRKVTMTGAGVSFQGPINRPDAPNLIPMTLPDGSQEFVSYLQPGAKLSDRYVGGKPNVIPFAESTELVQEFALDYILPFEALQSVLQEQVLGSTADPWKPTTVTSPGGQVAYDNQTFSITQAWDHPNDTTKKALGPTLNEGPTPARRGNIIEKSQGTLVGYNHFDKLTYGQVLKPNLFTGPPSQAGAGRFGADVESGYAPVKESTDHVESRLAASCLAIRFPYEYNTTRLDVTKEGFVSMEIGSTLPKEKVGIGDKTYEHPHGAGRSLEAHFVGSVKAVIGKNRDEEEAIDLQALGQTVLRLGADDTSLPDAGRTVQTQIRGQSDRVFPRKLQYWDSSKLSLGDSKVDTNGYNKKGAENVSLRAALDGAAIVRIGARSPKAKRRHLINGYTDGKGEKEFAPYSSPTPADPSTQRKDAHSPGRPTYPPGDSNYAFNDLTKVGEPNLPYAPYAWSGSPVTDMDAHGLSLDVHTVRDILLRIGANPASGQSLLLDLAGGLVAALGVDHQGRSITADFLGGIEITIKPNKQGKAIRLEVDGDIDITHKGHLEYHCTGDWITECTTRRHITKTDDISSQQKKVEVSLVRHTIQTIDMVHDQGTQVPIDFPLDLLKENC